MSDYDFDNCSNNEDIIGEFMEKDYLNNEGNESDSMMEGSGGNSSQCENSTQCEGDNGATDSFVVHTADAGGDDVNRERGHSDDLKPFAYYTEKYTKSERKKKGLLQMIAVSLVSSILGAALVGSYFQFLAPGFKSAATERYNSQQSESSDTGESQGSSGTFSNIAIENSDSTVSAIAEKVGPSVVGIRTTAATRGMFGLQQQSGEGSGIVYTKDGYIVTNYHVIQNAVDQSSKKVASGAKIEVVLPSKKDEPYEAQVVGYDSRTDLAVIKIEASNLPAAEWGNSDNLKVGELAVAIGNPGGLEYMGSVTAGVISGLNRTIETENGKILKLIQTDAAINPGNSGGALVNSKGQVIGINSVKIVAEGFEGIGFAIPSNTVKEIVDNLMEYKYVKGRPYIGISIDQRFNEQVAKLNNLPTGVYVADVDLLSGAYKAGIKAGDIITKFDGQTVKSYNELESLKNEHKPGDVISVEIYREGQTLTVQVKLGEDMSN